MNKLISREANFYITHFVTFARSAKSHGTKYNMAMMAFMCI